MKRLKTSAGHVDTGAKNRRQHVDMLHQQTGVFRLPEAMTGVQNFTRKTSWKVNNMTEQLSHFETIINAVERNINDDLTEAEALHRLRMDTLSAIKPTLKKHQGAIDFVYFLDVFNMFTIHCPPATDVVDLVLDLSKTYGKFRREAESVSGPNDPVMVNFTNPSGKIRVRVGNPPHCKIELQKIEPGAILGDTYKPIITCDE